MINALKCYSNNVVVLYKQSFRFWFSFHLSREESSQQGYHIQKMNIGQCYFTLCLAKSKRRGFDTIVSFGDSNSATGNYHNLSGNQWLSSPYYQGRFSDGPLWVERSEIPNHLNYAYAGATTDNEFANSSIYDANITTPGVRQQVNMYKNSANLRRTDFSRTL